MIWTVLAAGRMIRRLAVRKPEVVYRAKLEPGRSLVIRHARTTEELDGLVAAGANDGSEGPELTLS
jgi:hypothetical protein